MQSLTWNTRLLFGPGALEGLRTLGARKTLLVSDPFFVKNGMAQRVLELCGGESRIFQEVKPDPALSQVVRGVALLEEFHPDTLIALGGGSAIDCAKGILSCGSAQAKLVAIPTTSGTGSEVTSFAVLTHEGVKHPLIDEALRPHTAILDPVLIRGLPKGRIADGGMDILTHCMEAAVGKNASLFTTAPAAYGVRLCLKLLPRSYQGDTEAGELLQQAATLAGLAFDQGGLGACHALSHALGGAFHLSHGTLNGILLPHVMEWNLPAAKEAYGELAALCGLGSTAALLFALRRLRKQLGLPGTLREAGLERGQVLQSLETVVAAAAADPCAKNNPRSLTAQALDGIVRRAL